MKKSNYLKMSLLALMPLLFLCTAFPCSMYKITSNGITMVGNNEDSWGRDSRIWFEQGLNGNYGAAYVGYLRKQLPDGGMNEHGLAFDAFTMPYKSNMPDRDPNKENFVYSHLKTILQQCNSVDEVYTFLEKPNLHVLNGLGTRGVTWAPYLANQLFNHIENNEKLDSEIDIKRLKGFPSSFFDI